MTWADRCLLPVEKSILYWLHVHTTHQASEWLQPQRTICVVSSLGGEDYSLYHFYVKHFDERAMDQWALGCLNRSKWTKCSHLYPADNGSASTLEEQSIDPIKKSPNGLPNFISFTWGICNFEPRSFVGSEGVEWDGGGQLKSARQIVLLSAEKDKGWEFNQDLLKVMVSYIVKMTCSLWDH